MQYKIPGEHQQVLRQLLCSLKRMVRNGFQKRSSITLINTKKRVTLRKLGHLEGVAALLLSVALASNIVGVALLICDSKSIQLQTEVIGISILLQIWQFWVHINLLLILPLVIIGSLLVTAIVVLNQKPRLLVYWGIGITCVIGSFLINDFIMSRIFVN